MWNTRYLPDVSRFRDHHHSTRIVTVNPKMPMVMKFGLEVRHTLRYRGVAHVLHVLHQIQTQKTSFQILILTENIQNHFSPSIQNQIMQMTYH